MNKFITSRYYLHLIIGLAIGYNLTSLTDFNKYSIINKVVGVSAITFIAFCFGFFWEWLQSKFFEGKTDWDDIKWSAIGGFIGSLLCFIFWNNKYVFYGNLILIITFVGREFYRQSVKNRR
jgi:hypothetical protein